MPTPNDFISVVIPAYNEESGIAECCMRLTSVMKEMGNPYELVFVNDGSRDGTLARLMRLRDADEHVKIVDFARNGGHQIAVTAGLDYATGDAIVIIDADLQDPPEIIPLMFEKYLEGYDVVYGKRNQRKGDSAFKRLTAWGFYRVLRWLSAVDIPADTGDFRLISRQAANAVRRMREHNRFLRGMFAWVGFRSTAVTFDRAERFAGETKYPLSKMLKLAGDGIFSFSMKPVALIAGLGCLLAAIGALWLVVSIIVMCVNSLTNAAMMNIMLSTLSLFTGLILASLGVVGQYVGRIHTESLARPLYFVAKTYGFENYLPNNGNNDNI